MGKLASDARGPIKRTLIWMSRREAVEDVVDYAAITSGRTLRELDQSRAWYVVPQNQLSVLVEQTGAPPQRQSFINEDGSRR